MDKDAVAPLDEELEAVNDAADAADTEEKDDAVIPNEEAEADTPDAVIPSEAETAESKDPAPEDDGDETAGDSSEPEVPRNDEADAEGDTSSGASRHLPLEGKADDAAAEDAPAKEKPKRKQTLVRRITGIVGYALIAGLALLIIFVFISNTQGKVTFIFGRTAMWVRTESMEPEIPARSYILVEKITAAEVNVGDVIVFRSSDPTLNGALNTHRVVDILGDGAEFVTQGDHNPGRDNYTALGSNVIGRYIKRLPIMTSFGRVMSTTLGIIITFTMIFVIFLIIYVPDMIRAANEKAAEAERIEKARIESLVAAEIEKLKAADEAKKAVGAASRSDEPEGGGPPAGTEKE